MGCSFFSISPSNFFAAEIWECDDCKDNRFPIWQTNASSISGMRNTFFLTGVLKNINSIFVYNDWVIVGVLFFFFSYKIIIDKVYK